MIKKKEKDPAFLMYPEKFLAGTFFMTDEQLGRYIKLLCLQHQKGHLTTEQMGKVLHDDDVEVFEKFIQDEEGKWYNLRLDQVIMEREEFAERQRLNGQKGGRPKANNNPNDKPKISPRNKEEDKDKEASHTIETNSPKLLFSKEPITPIHNSLEDLYDTL
jgi:uncharacterized protein YdaU (DUF1376 family)